MASTTKLSLSSLPLSKAQFLIPANLNADSAGGKTPSAFINEVLANTPSVQRRSRLMNSDVHFSFVSPFPYSFPYDIRPPEEGSGEALEAERDKASYIEKWLSAREARHPANSDAPLQKMFSQDEKRNSQPRVLLSVSQSCVNDCLPNLDIESQEGKEDLIDILSGKALLTNAEFAPYSLRYSGHQFGTWAGQLGDGRAVSVLVTPGPTPSSNIELQIKGAGRTPYSRTADGLAVTRSSIREYLAAETMAALGIPTTRSLSMIALPTLPVERETLESAAIVTRVAESFIRVGSFQALSPPQDYGWGTQKPDYEALRQLGEFVSKTVLKLNINDGDKWARELVLESSRRNARMLAAWQVYGFMHGVMNTDNISIMGLTLDYGPYAFMDTYDPLHICNHTDEGGRYSYRNQPSIIVHAMLSLRDALSPIIGAEEEQGAAVTEGWVPSVPDAPAASEGLSAATREGLESQRAYLVEQRKEQINVWKKAAMDMTESEVREVVQEEMSIEYGKLMAKRLGLPPSSNASKLAADLLDLMKDQALDFHIVFRLLCHFTPGAETADIVKDLIATSTSSYPLDNAGKQWSEWLDRFADMITESKVDPGERKEAMLKANPRFVLRQWVLEEVIKSVENELKVDSRDEDDSTIEQEVRAKWDNSEGKKLLERVLSMCIDPFRTWGDEFEKEALSEDTKEERRLCGVGSKEMLGFQCSCSS